MSFIQIRNLLTFWVLIFSLTVFSSISAAQNINSAKDTITTASGLKYIILEKGNGIQADSGKEVEVNYNWYLTNGSLIGSSINTDDPYYFVLGTGKVVKGWDEGISYMHVGDHFRFIIPPQLGCGSTGYKYIVPPNATLIFDTYLLSVGNAKNEIVDTLLNLTMNNGVDSAISLYKKLYNTERNKYLFIEDQLNILGFKLLMRQRKDDAIKILKLNIEMYPESAKALNNMGTAYLKLKDRNNALKYFEKALILDPENNIAKYEIGQLKKKDKRN